MYMDKWMDGWQVPSTSAVDMYGPVVWRLQDVDGAFCANGSCRVAHGAQDINVNRERPFTALPLLAPSVHARTLEDWPPHQGAPGSSQSGPADVPLACSDASREEGCDTTCAGRSTLLQQLGTTFMPHSRS